MKWILITSVMAMPALFFAYNYFIKNSNTIFILAKNAFNTLYMITYVELLLKVKSVSEVLGDKDYVYSGLASCFLMILVINIILFSKSKRK